MSLQDSILTINGSCHPDFFFISGKEDKGRGNSLCADNDHGGPNRSEVHTNSDCTICEGGSLSGPLHEAMKLREFGNLM